MISFFFFFFFFFLPISKRKITWNISPSYTFFFFTLNVSYSFFFSNLSVLTAKHVVPLVRTSAIGCVYVYVCVIRVNKDDIENCLEIKGKPLRLVNKNLEKISFPSGSEEINARQG